MEISCDTMTKVLLTCICPKRSLNSLCNSCVIVPGKCPKKREISGMTKRYVFVQYIANQRIKNILEFSKNPASNTQNPVRATSCRFDSDLRHLLFQYLPVFHHLFPSSLFLSVSVFCPCFAWRCCSR